MFQNSSSPRADYDRSFTSSEDEVRAEKADDLLTTLQTNQDQLTEFLHILEGARPATGGPLHLMQILAWDDRVNDMKELIKQILRGIEQ